MNLYFRLVWLLLKRSFLKQHIQMTTPCKTDFTVNIFDLDVNFHMNNGRYLSLMDLGRVDLMIQTGVLWRLLRGGYFPVVVSEAIRFKKSFELFDSIQLVTKMESIGEKDFWISQQFFRGSELIAEGLIKGRFLRRGKRGSVSTDDLFKVMNLEKPQMEITQRSALLSDIEDSLAMGVSQISY